MAEVATPPPTQRKKSVAFSDGEILIDGNGDVTTRINDGEDKTSAESHSQPNGDVAVEEATAEFDALALKKKKKAKKPKDEDKVADDADDAPAAEAEFDASTIKKKKKKDKAPKADADDFESRLAEAAKAEKAEVAQENVDDGDMDEGTGIWAHEADKPINYNQLLSRFFKLLNDYNPEHSLGGSKSYKIPPPQCLREGNKKTIFANIAEICKRMKRTEEHVTQFLFAELGTNGSTDGSRRLVIKGKFLQKQIENVLRRYIMEYVTCKTCRSLDTELLRGENRLYFVNCNSCGSRRSVQSIKAGFTAQVGKRKRQQG